MSKIYRLNLKIDMTKLFYKKEEANIEQLMNEIEDQLTKGKESKDIINYDISFHEVDLSEHKSCGSCINKRKHFAAEPCSSCRENSNWEA